jgi:septation ring formation regulator EzrA
MFRTAPLILACAVLLALGGGCWVTSTKLTDRFNEFDEYLKKRESRTRSEKEMEFSELNRQIAVMRSTLQGLEVTLKGINEEIRDIREKMGLALDSANRIKKLQDEVESSLGEVHAIEARLNRNFKKMDDRVGETLDKYREVLLEEKRVMMERLRTLNETLRALAEGEGKEEGGGKDGE